VAAQLAASQEGLNSKKLVIITTNGVADAALTVSVLFGRKKLPFFLSNFWYISRCFQRLELRNGCRRQLLQPDLRCYPGIYLGGLNKKPKTSGYFVLLPRSLKASP
jgi:hypothetical protein